MDNGNTCNTTFKEIKEDHGLETFQLFKKLLQAKKNLATYTNKRIFLLRCKNLDLTPKFLNFKISHLEIKNKNIQNKFHNRTKNYKSILLNYIISDCTHSIKQSHFKINELNGKLKNSVNAESWPSIEEKINHTIETLFKTLKTKHQKKLNILIKKTDKVKLNQQTNPNQVWLCNISDTIIPDPVAKILSLGPNFAVKYHSNNQIPVHNIIANVESSIDNLKTNEKNIVRSKLSNIIVNHKNANNKNINHDQKLLNKNINFTKKFIKQNPQIIITKPDKSNKTVILNKTDYENKMQTLLNDTNTYKKLTSNPTTKYQKLNNNLIKSWENSNLISPETAKNLKINNAHPPRIYGLPKLHKPDIPLRPIVSSIQSPLYKLSKYLSNTITNIIGKNDHYIKNSFEFKNFINDIYIPEDHILISLDVVSMYTNIPTNLAKLAIEKNWNNLKNYTTLTKEEFLKATEITLNSTYFQYNNEFYQQIQGCAMGSPISSNIAQLVMEELEENIIQQLDFKPIFFKRYVDDCIACIPKNKVNQILTKFNSINEKIQFTIEIEKEKSINFLDLTLIRTKNQIRTKLYFKPTASGRYLNFNSYQPLPHKKNVISALINRATKLTSPELRPKVLQQIKQLLKNNSYPQDLINSVIRKQIHKLYNNQNNNKNKTDPYKYVTIPYVQNLSEKLNKILIPYNIKVAHKNHNNFKQLFTNIKDPIPKNKKTHTVYKIPCHNCDKVYIGQTIQHLNDRINGHKFSNNITALKKHVTQTKHSFNYEETSILTTENNNKARNILESIYIQKHKNSVNDRTDLANISNIYFHIL